MNLRGLFDDNEAVSSVISVILMVAVTVILAAVLATFALGFGENTDDIGPSADFEFDYSRSTGQLQVRHASGDTLKASNLAFKGAYIGDSSYGGTPYTGKVKSGNIVTVDVNTDETFRVVWADSTRESTVILSEFEVPDEGPAPSVSGSFSFNLGGVDGSTSGTITVPTIDNTKDNEGYLVIENKRTGSTVKKTAVSSGDTVSFTTTLDSTQSETIGATLYESASKSNTLGSDTYVPAWANVHEILVIYNTQGCNDYVEYDLEFGGSISDGNPLDKVYIEWVGSNSIRNEHTSSLNDFKDGSNSNTPGDTTFTVGTQKGSGTSVSGTILQTGSKSSQSSPCNPP